MFEIHSLDYSEKNVAMNQYAIAMSEAMFYFRVYLTSEFHLKSAIAIPIYLGIFIVYIYII